MNKKNIVSLILIGHLLGAALIFAESPVWREKITQFKELGAHHQELAPLCLPLANHIDLLRNLHDKMEPHRHNNSPKLFHDFFLQFAATLCRIELHLDVAINQLRAGNTPDLQKLMHAVHHATSIAKDFLPITHLLPATLQENGRFIPIPVPMPSSEQLGTGLANLIKVAGVSLALFITYKAFANFFTGDEKLRLENLDKTVKEQKKSLTTQTERLEKKITDSYESFTTEKYVWGLIKWDGSVNRHIKKLHQDTEEMITRIDEKWTAALKHKNDLLTAHTDLFQEINYKHAKRLGSPKGTQAVKDKRGKAVVGALQHQADFYEAIESYEQQINTLLKALTVLQNKLTAIKQAKPSTAEEIDKVLKVVGDREEDLKRVKAVLDGALAMRPVANAVSP